MTNRGFTLFVAIVVTGTILLIATGLINLAVRQAFITSSGRESQNAFYAADTGIECVLYWDVQNPSGFSAFATSSTSVINCNQNAANPANPSPATVGGADQSTFEISFQPDSYCAIVTVTKELDGSTKIESRGYNTCSSSDPRRVERAIRVTY